MKKQSTLCIVHQHPKILLGMKKRGFGEGRWNGFGGKLNQGESVEQAAVRELQEEAGIVAEAICKKGIVEFSFENDPKVLEVHIFHVEKFSGEPVESDEMNPQWFHVDEIPYNLMWPDDAHWMPYLLRGDNFKGAFHFDKPSTADYSAKILHMNLEKVKDLYNG